MRKVLVCLLVVLLAACAENSSRFGYINYEGPGDTTAFFKAQYDCYKEAQTRYLVGKDYGSELLTDEVKYFDTCSDTKFKLCLRANGYTRVKTITNIEIKFEDEIRCRAP